MRQRSMFSIVNAILLGVLAIIMVFPFYYVVVLSFSNLNDYLDSALLYPKSISFDAYTFVFSKPLIRIGISNTLIITIIGVAYNLFLTIPMSYALSKRFPGRDFVMNLVVVTMFFGGGLIPFYLIVSNVLHLQNSLAAVLLPYGVNSFYMIIMKNYFATLPKELEESARIDGAGEFTILRSIILPIALPILATFGLFYSVDRWNEWFNAMLFMRDERLYTLQLVLRDIIVTMTNMQTQQLGDLAHRQVFNGAVKAATIVIATVPIMIVYPFLQKYFAQGMLIGAIKS